jgi:hypothetical protein
MMQSIGDLAKRSTPCPILRAAAFAVTTKALNLNLAAEDPAPPMDPKDLPKEWSNPVYPLYRLPRPLNNLLDHSIAGPSRIPAFNSGIRARTRARI